ncbi:IS3 family transposase [Halobacillus salinus]|uniref:IS3 family transposase n=1 Tax=Halobacillus salinus TaxID=192814 RepID=UPI0011171FE2|nr:IS3 family transposase [Halobacillus salinus]
MTRIMFTEAQRKELASNPNVLKVSDRSITYAPAFKVKAVKENEEGKSPSHIFVDHGFDMAMIGVKKPKECVKRWRKVFHEYGEDGFYTERRGKGSTGRPSSKHMSSEDQLKKAKARIAYLEAELDFNKKARRTRKAGEEEEITTSEKFQLIERVLRTHGFPHMTRYFCEVARVSRSGYYNWLNSEDARRTQERNDEADYEILKKVFDRRQGKIGALSIKMMLENDEHIVMNHKRIRRIMKKYNLICTIRRANPYKKIAQATQEHQTCDNKLERHFDHEEPQRVLLTDITYLYYAKGQKAYLSAIKDGATREILAYYLSTSLKMDIVYTTLNKLMEREDFTPHPDCLIHSDQGMHYTHPEFQKKVKDLGLHQSMSRRGNCWDNAPMESFFGHMKDGIDFKAYSSLAEVQQAIDEYMEYYNNHRYQWSLQKMTPAQYRGHLIAA